MNEATRPARVGISGAAGRMGRSLVEAVLAMPDRLQLAAALEQGQSADLGRDIGLLLGRPPLGIAVAEHWDAGTLDVLIDFTRPEATLARLGPCCSERVAMVIGTTGFDTAQQARLEAAGAEIALCQAGNFSLGVHLLRRLVEQASRSLGPDFDIEIVEAHHRHKVDAPSGTALMLGDAAARGQGRTLDDRDVFAREGHTGPRPAGVIGFSVVRGGDVVGDHEVHFLGEGERLALTHKASSRMNFARGAARAAAWLAGRAPGHYSLDDIFK
jgi:4-hydroxy-tetrahydrodipicolinate reductase